MQIYTFLAFFTATAAINYKVMRPFTAMYGHLRL
jgi:hypothetical protein